MFNARMSSFPKWLLYTIIYIILPLDKLIVSKSQEVNYMIQHEKKGLLPKDARGRFRAYTYMDGHYSNFLKSWTNKPLCVSASLFIK